MIRTAREFDMPGVGAVYRRAFPESVDHIFGGDPGDQTFVDIFRFLLDVYPGYFIVDDEGGKVAGYVVVSPDVSILVARAIFRGYVLRWVWHWLTRRYHFGLRPVWTLLADKWALLASKGKATESSDARILSIAVDPDYRGTGMGEKLARAGLKLLKDDGIDRVMLEVRKGNIPAAGLYSKLGFREVGRFSDRGGVWIQMILETPDKRERAA